MTTWLSILHDSTRAFGMLTCRRDIPKGSFGHVAIWWCYHCAGPCGEPEYHMTHRQTWEQPEEGVMVCPECGYEDCGEHDDPKPMKVLNRYSIHRNPSYRGAV